MFRLITVKDYGNEIRVFDDYKERNLPPGSGDEQILSAAAEMCCAGEEVVDLAPIPGSWDSAIVVAMKQKIPIIQEGYIHLSWDGIKAILGEYHGHPEEDERLIQWIINWCRHGVPGVPAWIRDPRKVKVLDREGWTLFPPT